MSAFNGRSNMLAQVNKIEVRLSLASGLLISKLSASGGVKRIFIVPTLVLITLV